MILFLKMVLTGFKGGFKGLMSMLPGPSVRGRSLEQVVPNMADTAAGPVGKKDAEWPGRTKVRAEWEQVPAVVRSGRLVCFDGLCITFS